MRVKERTTVLVTKYDYHKTFRGGVTAFLCLVSFLSVTLPQSLSVDVKGCSPLCDSRRLELPAFQPFQVCAPT